MKIDKLDIKIKEAGDQYDPVYSEQDWSKMEKLLDEEMPQKKTKKRGLFWIFLLWFIVAISLLLLTYLGKNAKEEMVAAKRNNISASAKINDPALIPSKPIDKRNSNTGGKASRQSRFSVSEPVNQKYFSEKSDKNYKDQTVVNKQSPPGNVNRLSLNNTRQNEPAIGNDLATPDKDLKGEQPNPPDKSTGTLKKEEAVENEKNFIIDDEKNNSLRKQNNKITSHKVKPSLSRENKFSNSFAISFSAGTDVSAISIDNIGKINLAYGAGIHYRFHKRWELRTGFYFAKKVYEAKPSDYHPPVRFWNYYPDLKSIEANCNVLEIPLIVNYNFSQTQKYSWFGAAGISSYFMKKEDYDYLSKDPAGRNSYHSYTINNQNKHYLSSIRLSGGYERKLGNNISISIEPYLNLPLSGIGYGKVKLYSSGILGTLSVKPFAKK